MDAKTKANFINSVSAGATTCPVCGSTNESGAAHCDICGAALHTPLFGSSSAPAFASIEKNGSNSAQENSVYAQSDSVFADGLPSWDVVPPQILVSRKKRVPTQKTGSNAATSAKKEAAITNQASQGRIGEFLQAAAKAGKFSEIMKIWKEMKLDTCDEYAKYTEDLSKKAEIERMYGSNQDRIRQFLEDLSKNCTG